MEESSAASVQAVVVQSPRLMRPMWMHSCVGGGGGGGGGCGDPHFVALNQQTPPCSSSCCGSGSNNNNNNVVPSFAPKTPCEGGTTIAVTNNNHNVCLLQPPSSSCLEKKVVSSGVVTTTTTTVVVPDNRVRAPFRLSNGKKSIGESDERWVQEHLGATKKRGKRKKVLLEEHEGITHHEMEEEEEEEEEGTEEEAPLLRNYHRNYFQQQLQPSVRKDKEEEPQRRRSSDYSCSSTHVGRVPSSEFQGNNNENKVQANILHMPIAADDSLMRQQEDLGNCKPRFHVGFTATLQQQEENERQQQQQQQRSQRRSFTASLCPPTTQQDNGGCGTGVFAAKRNVNSICSLRTSQREPEDADCRKSKMVCSSVVKPPSQSSLVVQEKTVLPGSCCFLSSSSSPQQMLQQGGGGVDPGTPFPLRKEVQQQQQQGLLQELDPGSSSSLLGMRTPQVVDGFSGRIAGGSLYSSPLGIPTPNPVVKSSSSSVGMMMMECGYHPRGGKGCRKASWEEEEEEGNMAFVEAGGSENGRESIPLACSGSSKLHAVPAYSPMPVAKQTVSSSEPSLLLTLNFSPMPPAGSMGLSLKTSTGQLIILWAASNACTPCRCHVQQQFSNILLLVFHLFWMLLLFRTAFSSQNLLYVCWRLCQVWKPSFADLFNVTMFVTRFF